MPCRRCVERGKTWEGDDPRCGFVDGGVFRSDNWNCATVNAVRERCKQPLWSDDQHMGAVPLDGSFLILEWYKTRGTTEYAVVLETDHTRPATLEDFEAVLSPTVEEQLDPAAPEDY